MIDMISYNIGRAVVATGTFISYLRVSTDAQGQSGLGLEAQRQAVADYLNGGSWTLIDEFVEVESGKRNDRPVLADAIAAARKAKATLVLAKMDRLGRRASYVLNLLDNSGIDFRFVEMPHASKLEIGIRAVVAEEEGRAISARTKAALAAAKARGVKLGNPDFAAARAKGIAMKKAAADERAESLLPVIRELQAAGAKTLRDLAAALNARDIPTPRGGKWYASSVRNVLVRAGDRTALAAAMDGAADG